MRKGGIKVANLTNHLLSGNEPQSSVIRSLNET
jgi:hypothetical protein